jgi:hypothetical protein
MVREDIMSTKIVSCVLLASLCFSLGCYNAEAISKAELKAQTEQADMTVFMKDSVEYKFIKDNYQVHGDTLSGFGVRTSGASTELVRNARLPLADIGSIESRGFNLKNTLLLCGGIGLVGGLIIVMLLPKAPQEVQVGPVAYVTPTQ